MDHYSAFGPKARRLFELADPNGFRVWKLLDMDEIPTWSNNHTTLLGDAAHPLLAFSFSGASMAVEDAVTLAVLLPREVEKEQIGERLKLYEEIRKPRLDVVRRVSRRRGEKMVSWGRRVT
jgi:salicylate hydroxylase